MGVKKGYMHTEVGVIPEDWIVKPVGSLLEFKNGLNKSKNFFGEGNYIVNYMDVYQKPGLSISDIKGKVTVSEDEKRNYHVKKGDVFFTRTSETIEEIGLSSVMLEEIDDAVFSGFVLRGRPKNDTLELHFKKYCFRSKIVRKQIISTSSYTTRALTNGGLLSKILIPYPPTLNEQTAIANALSDVDELIQSLEKLITKKRAVKQGTMQKLLQPKENWVVKKLGELFDFSGGFSASRNQLSNEGYCYLHYGDIHGSTKTYVNVIKDFYQIPKLQIELKKVSRKLMLNDGDVVFVDASEDEEGASRHIVIENPAGIPFIAGLHTIVAKSRDETIDNKYKRYCFQCDFIKRQFNFFAVGTKVKGISKANIKKIDIYLPSLEEQTHIANILSDMDEEIANLEFKVAKYKQIKLGMMQSLLTGRVRLV